MKGGSGKEAGKPLETVEATFEEAARAAKGFKDIVGAKEPLLSLLPLQGGAKGFIKLTAF